MTGGDHTQHPQPADHAVEQVAVFLGRAGDFCAGGQDGRELGYVLADGAHAEIVLAVDVRAQAAAQRGGHRAGDDRRPPAIWQDFLPELFQRDARFASDYAGSCIPFDDLIHARHIQHDAAAV